MRRLAILCLLPLALNGCAGMLLTAGTQAGITAAENRSVGRKMDDTVIYTDLTNQFLQEEATDLLGHVTFNVRYARVMLTGNVKSETEAQKAVEISWRAKGVTEIINELNINPDNTLLDTAGDSLVKRNLEARLFMTKGVWVINYSIDVTNGNAYLIGRVEDKEELDKVLSICRTTKGVKKVVSHLQINTDTANAITAPDGSGGVSNTTSSRPDAALTTTKPGNDDVYTGPVYGSGSIESEPLTPPSGSSKSSKKPFSSGTSATPGGGY